MNFSELANQDKIFGKISLMKFLISFHSHGNIDVFRYIWIDSPPCLRISYAPCRNLRNCFSSNLPNNGVRCGITKRLFFRFFFPLFFFWRKRNKEIILKVNLARLHLNRTDNLWQSARGEILWAIKRSLWAYNVTYSPCNFAEWMQEWLHRIERAHVSRRIFFVLAVRLFVLKSVSKEFRGAASLGAERLRCRISRSVRASRASKFSRKCATMLIHFEIVIAIHNFVLI